TIRKIETLNQKAKSGFKDPERLIRQKLFSHQPISITVIIGKTAIIDKDILHALSDAAPSYNLQFHRIALNQPELIIQALNIAPTTDILAIACGGGEHLNIFNQPAIAEQALTLTPIFITALGHAADEPLLQKVADKAFITPTAMGQYLRQI